MSWQNDADMVAGARTTQSRFTVATLAEMTSRHISLRWLDRPTFYVLLTYNYTRSKNSHILCVVWNIL